MKLGNWQMLLKTSKKQTMGPETQLLLRMLRKSRRNDKVKQMINLTRKIDDYRSVKTSSSQ